MDELLATIGRRIRSSREVRDLSQERLAERAKINASFLSQIERGLKAPSLRTLAAIAKELDVPVGQLLAEEEATTALVEGEIAELLAGATVEQQKDLLDLLRVGVKLTSI